MPSMLKWTLVVSSVRAVATPSSAQARPEAMAPVPALTGLWPVGASHGYIVALERLSERIPEVTVSRVRQ